MAEKEGKIHIGTSGWHYAHWKGTFYPPKTPSKDFMEFYLRYFRTVEINNSFYRLPSPETFASWKNAVPADFTFAVKASRFITHMKKLKDPVQSLERFLHSIVFLEEKLGPILFQLPPMWKLDFERLKNFIEVLPPYYRYTFEFRHPDWYNERVYELLQQYNMAFCNYELAHHLSPIQVTADFVYVRLHGPGEGKYQGSYSDEALQGWARQANEWKASGKDVYIYFDNDEQGFAAFNARSLKEMTNGRDF